MRFQVQQLLKGPIKTDGMHQTASLVSASNCCFGKITLSRVLLGKYLPVTRSLKSNIPLTFCFLFSNHLKSIWNPFAVGDPTQSPDWDLDSTQSPDPRTPRRARRRTPRLRSAGSAGAWVRCSPGGPRASGPPGRPPLPCSGPGRRSTRTAPLRGTRLSRRLHGKKSRRGDLHKPRASSKSKGDPVTRRHLPVRVLDRPPSRFVHSRWDELKRST